MSRTAIGILTGAVGEPLILDLLGGDLPDGLAFLIALSFVTYLSAVFGELVPKALAGDVRLQVEQLDGHRITRLLVRIDGRITQNA
jgi:CBS domain containing-hemolysin-like protein